MMHFLNLIKYFFHIWYYTKSFLNTEKLVSKNKNKMQYSNKSENIKKTCLEMKNKNKK